MSQSIQVSFVQEGDVYTVHTGSSVLKDIVMDYTGVPETERGGNSSTLLIAAALSCFCGSIRAALVARGVPFRAIRAQGTGTKEPNADGAMRLVGGSSPGISVNSCRPTVSAGFFRAPRRTPRGSRWSSETFRC